MFVKFGYEICSNRTLCSEFHIKCEKKTDLLTHVFILFVFVHTLRCLLFVVVFFINHILFLLVKFILLCQSDKFMF